MTRLTWYWQLCFMIGSVLVNGAPLLWPHMWPIEGHGVGSA